MERGGWGPARGGADGFLALLALALPAIAAARWRLGAYVSSADLYAGLLASGAALVCLPPLRARMRVPRALLSGIAIPAAAFVVLRAQSLAAFLGFAVACAIAGALEAFSRGRRRAALRWFGAAGVGLALIVGEVALCAREPRPPTNEFRGRLSRRDPLLSSRLIPGGSGIHTLRAPDGRPIFEVRYEVAADGTRTVPGRPDDGRPLLVVGGSFAFGQGLPDEQTIPARLQAMAEGVRVTNAGGMGYGTADARNRLREVLEGPLDRPIVAYLMIGDHVRRTACPDEMTAQDWGARKPRFDLVDGRPVHLGPAIETLGLAHHLRVNLLTRSCLYRRLHSIAKARWRQSPRDSALVRALLAEMRAWTEEAGGRFVVVALPTRRDLRKGWDQRFAGLLDEMGADGLEVIDLCPRMRALLESEGIGPDALLLPDAHPNGRYAELAADWIAEALELSEGGD